MLPDNLGKFGRITLAALTVEDPILQISLLSRSSVVTIEVNGQNSGATQLVVLPDHRDVAWGRVAGKDFPGPKKAYFFHIFGFAFLKNTKKIRHAFRSEKHFFLFFKNGS